MAAPATEHAGPGGHNPPGRACVDAAVDLNGRDAAMAFFFSVLPGSVRIAR